MGAVVALSDLVDTRRVWRGRAEPVPTGDQPTGLAALDAVLPTAGWPDASVSEILIPLDGLGELRLVLPTLARLWCCRHRPKPRTPWPTTPAPG